MSHYFPKPYSSCKDVKVTLDLSKYGTKFDAKKEIVDDKSLVLKIVYLISLKLVVDKLNIDKILNVIKP